MPQMPLIFGLFLVILMPQNALSAKSATACAIAKNKILAEKELLANNHFSLDPHNQNLQHTKKLVVALNNWDGEAESVEHACGQFLEHTGPSSQELGQFEVKLKKDKKKGLFANDRAYNAKLVLVEETNKSVMRIKKACCDLGEAK